MSETEEIRKAQGGDLEACSRLFAGCHGLVRAWLRGFSRDPDEIDDLAQQTFLRAFTRLRQLRDPDRFRPWLRKVARSVALGRRRRALVLPGPQRLAAESAAEEAARTEETARVERSLARLSRFDRSLLALVYEEDLPLAEAARFLDLAVTTFRRRLAAALGRFRRAYEREGGIVHGLPRRA